MVVYYVVFFNDKQFIFFCKLVNDSVLFSKFPDKKLNEKK